MGGAEETMFSVNWENMVFIVYVFSDVYFFWAEGRRRRVAFRGTKLRLYSRAFSNRTCFFA